MAINLNSLPYFLKLAVQLPFDKVLLVMAELAMFHGHPGEVSRKEEEIQWILAGLPEIYIESKNLSINRPSTSCSSRNCPALFLSQWLLTQVVPGKTCQKRTLGTGIFSTRMMSTTPCRIFSYPWLGWMCFQMHEIKPYRRYGTLPTAIPMGFFYSVLLLWPSWQQDWGKKGATIHVSLIFKLFVARAIYPKININIFQHVSGVTCHMSCVMCHPLDVTCPMSLTPTAITHINLFWRGEFKPFLNQKHISWNISLGILLYLINLTSCFDKWE